MDILRRKHNDNTVQPAPDTDYNFVAQAPEHLKQRPLIVGTGPCGLFAGLLLAQMGFTPILLERGKPVRERTQDTLGFWRQRKLDPESNVQFGQGGAGTFSDGKLHTQIKDKNHLGRKVLTEFVNAGAPEEILYISKTPYWHAEIGQDRRKNAQHHPGLGRRISFSKSCR